MTLMHLDENEYEKLTGLQIGERENPLAEILYFT